MTFFMWAFSQGVTWGKVSFHDHVDSVRNILALSFELYTEKISDEESSPHTIYYPFINCTKTGDTEDAKSFTLVKNPKNNAPCRIGGNLEGQVLISVTADTDGYVYGAFETAVSNQFQVIQIQEGGHGGQANEVVINQGQVKSIRVDLGNACRHLSCVLPDNDSAILSRRLLIFHSPSEEDNLGDTLNIGDPQFQEGEIYNLQMARKLPSSSQKDKLPHYTLSRGDTQVFINYNTIGLSINNEDIRALRVVIYPDAQKRNVEYCDTQNNQDCDQLCGTQTDCTLQRLEESLEKEESEVVLSHLGNDAPVHLSVCVENKWGFCSLFPPSQMVIPKTLETFLQEQSCFFFSAGFGREHYVIDRLKRFRDHFLKKLPGGKAFIDLYYSFAPPYARYVANHSFLRGSVRALGYLLYWIIQYYYILGMLILGGIGYKAILGKRKSQSS